jgi:hypothetical protein
MSSAFYPLGMKSYNNHVPQGGYRTWKGTGVNSNPVGVAASHIRPLTNNDPGNVFQTGFGLPRPIKHYRKGRVIPAEPIVLNPSNPAQQSLINYNLNRIVKSSDGSSLGGGSGGLGLLGQMIDNPGGYVVKQNSTVKLPDEDCRTCEGVGIVATYYPNIPYLTENPEPTTQTHLLCCNDERKALRRVLPASTILKKNYYTTHTQYLQNRCQTYQQRAFNFQSPNPVNIAEMNSGNPFVTKEALLAAKPGSALALFNTYFANCQPNGEIYQATEIALINRMLDIMLSRNIIDENQYNAAKNIVTIDAFFNYLVSLNNPQAIAVFVDFINNPYYGVPSSGPTNPAGCKLVVYKPNNPQFAQQGAVSSSTRMLKLNVDTIQLNAAKNNLSNLYKNKAPQCGAPQTIRYQNKKSCFLSPSYSLYSIPNQPPFSSNHFAQSPRNPLM